MTANRRSHQAPKHGRQKDWPKRRAPIARLRRGSRAHPRTHRRRTEGCP